MFVTLIAIDNENIGIRLADIIAVTEWWDSTKNKPSCVVWWYDRVINSDEKTSTVVKGSVAKTVNALNEAALLAS